MHVVACEVQRDQKLEDHAPSRLRGGEENEQTCRGAAVGDHVQDCAEAGRLLVDPRGMAIEGVEQAGDGVEDGAAARVEGHIVEGYQGEEDARVA